MALDRSPEFIDDMWPIVQQRRTIWANVVKVHLTTIPVKFYRNWSSGYGGNTLKWLFYFYPWQPSCEAERNDLGNFGRGSPNDHSCEVSSKSAKQLRRRRRLKFFSIFSPGRKLVQRSETIWAILVGVNQQSFLWSFVKICQAVQEEKSFKVFFYL